MSSQSEKSVSDGIIRWSALRGWLSLRREISRRELQEYVWKLEKGILKIKQQQAKKPTSGFARELSPQEWQEAILKLEKAALKIKQQRVRESQKLTRDTPH